MHAEALDVKGVPNDVQCSWQQDDNALLFGVKRCCFPHNALKTGSNGNYSVGH
jgi:hypothetical protein